LKEPAKSSKIKLCFYYIYFCFILLSYSCGGDNQPSVELKSWSVSQKGTILEIGYGSHASFPQYAALYLCSGYFRMTYGSKGGWGTSVILLPSFWESGEYRQGAPINATWETSGNDLVISFNGRISSLNVDGKIRLLPPGEDNLVAEVSVKVDGNVQLDKTNW
jgi:hypothetical protein